MLGMQVTSAEANKLLKKIYNEREAIYEKERERERYHAAVGEDPDELKPDYNLDEIRKEIEDLNRDEMEIKHALNLFNATTKVGGGYNYTIDQVLIRLPQLNTELRRLDTMRMRPSKIRAGITGSVIDYIYTSYDPDAANEYHWSVQEEIDELQIALDKVNTTVKFDI